MVLTPMRFKGYVWPHNPRVYEVMYKRTVAAHKIPAGRYILQNMGLSFRALRGEGEFFGKEAYAEFQKLADVFAEETPGLLQHPVWRDTNAYFAALSVSNEPAEDYVKYSFEFWECYDGYEEGIRLVKKAAVSAASTAAASAASTAGEAVYYTVKSGDCLWNIAARYGVTLAAVAAMNPQIKNPNLIYPGDVVRVG